MPGPFADNALAFRRAGLSPIPTTGANGKRPAIRGFMRYAKYRASESTVEKWSQAFPDANVGIMAGAVSGITVVDVDDADLVGDAIFRCGDTPVIDRGQRGYHLYYQFGAERTTNRLDGTAIDVRAAQGNPLIIVPPSIRPDTGARWEWERGRLPRDLSKLPLVKPGSLPLMKTERLPLANEGLSGGVTEGQRSDWLFCQALQAARSYATLEALTDKARTLNMECTLPLTDAEVVSTAQSAWRIQANGTNRVGQGGYAQITAQELETLGGNSDAALLLMHLRAAHSCRGDAFALTPKFGLARGWTKPRFYRAREFLENAKLIERTHYGGIGCHDPARYRLS